MFLHPSYSMTSKLLNTRLCLLCSIHIRRTISSGNENKENFKRISGWKNANDELYGPILTKVQVERVVEKNKSDRSNTLLHRNVYKDEVNRRKLTQDNKNVKLTKSQELDLGKLVHFPLFATSKLSTLSLDDFLRLPQHKLIASHMNGYTPGVTRIISETMSPESRFFLDRWEKEMIEKLGEEGFKQYKKETFARGENLHTCIEKHLQGTPISDLDITPNIELFWDSIHKLMPDFTDVQHIEQKVKHQYLGYSGYFDCVAKFRNTLCLIDWKTSKKQKDSIKHTFDNPLQVAAYLGAYNFDPKYKDAEKIENALIVIAYEDGRPAHAHFLTRDQCMYYWGQWLNRLHTYWTNKEGQLLRIDD